MKLVCFIPEENKRSESAPKWGIVEDDEIRVINSDPFSEWEKTEEYYKVYDVRFMAPSPGGKIICAGLNYSKHAKELGMSMSPDPVLFIKASSSLLRPGGTIIKPRACRQLDYEAELALIIGKKTRNCPVEEMDDKILGYSCFNDVTARDIQKADGQWTRAKSYDTFAPLGPFISTGIDPGSLDIKLYLNGQIKQSSNTADMLLRPEKIASYVSSVMTLMPGDVVSTGTPTGVGRMNPGDVVEVEIEKVGTLKNYVVQEGDVDV